MTGPRHGNWTPEHNILFAHASCLCLGIGMLLWGLAPALVERLITDRAPSLHAFLLNSLVFVLGLAFIGMHVLVRRRIRWAVWAAFLVSATLAAAGLALTTASGFQLSSSFLLLLSMCTCFATWLAIATLTREAIRKLTQPEPITQFPRPRRRNPN